MCPENHSYEKSIKNKITNSLS
ncbi:hypothetical protein AB1K09_08045 [Solibacillus silvestris]